jgi:hypothetical protein
MPWVGFIAFFFLWPYSLNSGLGRLHKTFRVTSVTRPRTVGRTPRTVDQLVARFIALNLYCGVFTPCKNCNIETISRNYATVDEAVFSPCRAVTSRASPCLVFSQAAAINTWMTQGWGRVTWPRQQWRNNLSVSRVSDQGFIGETEANSGVVIGEFSAGIAVSSRWVTAAGISWVASFEQSSCEDLKCDVKTLCVI